MTSANRPYTYRPNNPDDMPMTGEKVFDLDRREHGTVTRRMNNGGGTVFVKFSDTEGEVMYTYRSALKVWKAFPGSAYNVGLRPLGT